MSSKGKKKTKSKSKAKKRAKPSPAKKPTLPAAVVILAAGQGKRMNSELPKVLHHLGGRPMLVHLLHQVREALPESPILVVAGHGREHVEEAVAAGFGHVDFVEQPVRRGTGDAARIAMSSKWGAKVTQEGRPVAILAGDMPLLSVELIKELTAPLAKGAALRLLSTDHPEPFGYGRVVRKGNKIQSVVEHRDCKPSQLKISEINAAIYTFDGAFLNKSLPKLKNNNAQKEYYLTDLVSMATKARKTVEPLLWRHWQEVTGINDLYQLSEANAHLNQRTLKHWASQGVVFEDLASTKIEASVKLSPGVRIGPGVILRGNTEVGESATIGPYCVLENMKIGSGCEVKTGTSGEDSSLDQGVKAGPYARFRPGSHVGENSKIGNFVELKNARIGKNTSAAHLSYLGDAEVGDGVNIGCGFITCNFDGRVINGSRKHKTVIEDEVFMGSDCQVIAPITIGKGSYVASGSTINKDVPEGALALGRSKQVNKEGYAKRFKPKKEGN